MHRSHHARASVAASLGLPARYAPLIPVIFARCENLGSEPARPLELLTLAKIGASSRVLELACGKGACSVAVARELGASVRAFDADAGFIAQARLGARRGGVAQRCRFAVADARTLPPPRTPFDAAIMIGWFGHERAARVLRERVKPGGHYLFDDAIPRDAGSADAVVAAHAAALGDELVASSLVPARELTRRVARDTALVAEGVRDAAAGAPRLARGLRGWLEGFAEAGRALGAGYRTGFWLVRRGG